MKISQYFTFDEFIDSQTAVRLGIDNHPYSINIELAIINTASRLDVVRALLGSPVLISSGYRSPELNKAIGGSPTSNHLTGEAVDFTCPLYGTPQDVFKRIRESSVQFDQLILEFGRWVHIGFGPKNRGQVLTYDGNTYQEAR